METENRHICIVGGGTAGWMTASALAKFYLSDQTKVTLIESEQIGTIGVGEATIPSIQEFNELLGIDEQTFMRETSATYKLGIDFIDWLDIGESYIHPFGEYRYTLRGLKSTFPNYFFKLKNAGIEVNLDDFSLPVIMCRQQKFTQPSKDNAKLLSTFSYAYHIDSKAYGQFLRRYAENNGVQRIEGKVQDVIVSTTTGDIEAVLLESGLKIEADLFIDCSGFRSLLLGQALQEPFLDWSKYLPCNRAIAVPTESVSAPLPYTKAKAHAAGWQWKIPLQHRVGNGFIYSDHYMSADDAETQLSQNVEGKLIRDPLHLRFRPGRYKRAWVKNVVGIGLSA